MRVPDANNSNNPIADSAVCLTAGPPTARLPGGYLLSQLLATTHFSSVWLASAPQRPISLAGNGTYQRPTASDNASGCSPDCASPDSSSRTRCPIINNNEDSNEGSNQMVVVKALDATRPSHAAVAANEAAALRHLAASVSTATAATTEDAVPAASYRRAADGSNVEVVGAHAPVDSAAAAAAHGGAGAFPFVRLLRTFTTDALPPPEGPADGAGRSGPSPGTGTSAPHTTADAGAGAGRRRWRCLVLERLGPTATEVLEAWQHQHEQDQEHLQQPGQHEQRGRQGGRREATRAPQELPGGLWAASRVAPQRRTAAAEPSRWQRGAAGIGHSGGLGPDAVRRFAVQALGALDLMHRSARIVHCDIKPDNFALRQLDGDSKPPSAGDGAGPPDAGWYRPSLCHPGLPTSLTHSNCVPNQQVLAVEGEVALDPGRQGPDGSDRQHGQWPLQQPGQGEGERRQRGPVREAGWALLDFGSACSLEPGGKHVADGPAGRDARGHVRPCAALQGDGDSDDYAWYDTPSYAAPELTLGLPPSPAADMWSLGCTVFELATGTKLLPLPPQLLLQTPTLAGRDSGGPSSLPDAAEFHLALVAQLLGRPPAALLRRAPRAGWYFDVSRRRLLLEEDFELPPSRALAERLALSVRRGSGSGGAGGAVAVGLVPLPAAGVAMVVTESGRGCGSNGDGVLLKRGPEVGAVEECGVARELGAVWGGAAEWNEDDWHGLHSFLVPLLQWDPRDRPPAHLAARHPWLTG